MVLTEVEVVKMAVTVPEDWANIVVDGELGEAKVIEPEELHPTKELPRFGVADMGMFTKAFSQTLLPDGLVVPTFGGLTLNVTVN